MPSAVSWGSAWGRAQTKHASAGGAGADSASHGCAQGQAITWPSSQAHLLCRDGGGATCLKGCREA